MNKQHVPQKGPFWLICELDPDANISIEKLICHSVELSQITPSHKEIWDSCKGNIKRAWNYYPRGRVEIKRDKAIAYANSYCFEYQDLGEQLRSAFFLGDMILEFKHDNSLHYTDGVFDKLRIRKTNNKRRY